MYLVVWTEKNHGSGDGRWLMDDHWSAHETLAEAEAAYAVVRDQSNCYSASICVPIESTDYSNPLED